MVMGTPYSYERVLADSSKYPKVSSDGKFSVWWERHLTDEGFRGMRCNFSNFSLANGEPGKVVVVQAPSRPGYTDPHAWISMELRAPISVYSTTEVGTLGGFVRPDVSRTFQTNGVMINFSDLALAQRQANAWRDLITACGGKDISDKLY
jgi:hypothetical protein